MGARELEDTEAHGQQRGGLWWELGSRVGGVLW